MKLRTIAAVATLGLCTGAILWTATRPTPDIPNVPQAPEIGGRGPS